MENVDKKLAERFGLTKDEVMLVKNNSKYDIADMAKKGYIRKDRVKPIMDFLETKRAGKAYSGGAGMEGPGEEAQLMYDLAPQPSEYEDMALEDFREGTEDRLKEDFNEEDDIFRSMKDESVGAELYYEPARPADYTTGDPKFMIEDDSTEGLDPEDLSGERARREMEESRKADSAYYADLEKEYDVDPGADRTTGDTKFMMEESSDIPQGEQYYMLKDSLKDAGLDEEEIKEWIKSMLGK
jgi:hypothetical protein